MRHFRFGAFPIPPHIWLIHHHLEFKIRCILPIYITNCSWSHGRETKVVAWLIETSAWNFSPNMGSNVNWSEEVLLDFTSLNLNFCLMPTVKSNISLFEQIISNDRLNSQNYWINWLGFLPIYINYRKNKKASLFHINSISQKLYKHLKFTGFQLQFVQWLHNI